MAGLDAGEHALVASIATGLQSRGSMRQTAMAAFARLVTCEL
jgi:hypothetical protein